MSISYIEKGVLAHVVDCLSLFFPLGFTPCKAEQPLQGMELRKRSTKRLEHTGNLFRKNLQLKGVCLF